MSGQRRAAIGGIHEFPLRHAPGWSPLQIKAASAVAALADAGLTLKDVDGSFDSGETGFTSGYLVPEYLGITPKVIDQVNVGGASFELLAARAAESIAAGHCQVALITYGSDGRSAGAAWGTGRPDSGGGAGGGVAGEVSPARNMEAPFGVNTVGNYALLATRHMHEYGTTREQLAEIAVVTRSHALRNPEAVKALTDIGIREVRELTIAEVAGAATVADPLGRYDCCLVTDGGGAVVIVSPEVARSLPKPPVWILGTGEAAGHGQHGDITTTAGARSGPDAFGMAGVRPSEIDVAMIYDSFTITVLAILEDLGFCKKGEGGAYVQNGRLRFDHPGGPALNTDGGGLSSNHPGRRGIFLLIEAARQLRGESTSQVRDARLAIAHGNGGGLGIRHSAGSVILGKD